MSYVLVENLSKTFSDKIILNNVTFSIEKGAKVALVAQNGTGKSTLLKIITEKEIYDSGKITKQKGVKVAFLDQEPELNENSTIKEEILASDSPIIRAVRLFEESLENKDDLEAVQIAFEEMTKHNAWEYEEKIQDVLKHLNLLNLNEKISTFSGGQKKRVALAKILIDSPDFLIMDEPTNHLDLEMIDWLEEYLEKQNITLLMVTHDRYFLERVCNQILELVNGNIYSYKGNYSYFLEKKASREVNHNVGIDKTKALLKRELEWVRKQPRGRQSKASARVNAYDEVKSNLQEKVVTEKVKLDIVGEYLGGKILEIHNLTKSFGDKKILSKFNYSFKRGEKVGIIGKNGVGKSTFLNLIMEKEVADSGKIVKGETVKFGYYSQKGLEFNENEKVIDSVKKVANYIKLSDGSELTATKMLERFLFTPIIQQNLISKLSGGEKKRLNLLKILMTNPNFLILDEPTNDFDILTLNVLEDFLKEFKGCLIIISHDRYFMDKIVDHLLVFKGDAEIEDYPGNYSQYRSEVRDEEKVKDASENNVVANPKKSDEGNDLYKEINLLEKKKENLNKKFYKENVSPEEIKKISLELEEISALIEKRTEEWLLLTNE
jgi:ATP-binding cassette subfamily F protein uup